MRGVGGVISALLVGMARSCGLRRMRGSGGGSLGPGIRRAGRVIDGGVQAGRLNSVFVRADRVVVVAVRAARVIVGVAQFCAAQPGDPANVAVVVEEVVPGRVAGSIQRLVVPQFGAVRGTGKIVGARARSTGVGRRFLGDRSVGPGAVLRKASRGCEQPRGRRKEVLLVRNR